jgi:hypothetical protein
MQISVVKVKPEIPVEVAVESAHSVRFAARMNKTARSGHFQTFGAQKDHHIERLIARHCCRSLATRNLPR